MRKLALLVPLLLTMTACQGFTWAGRGSTLTDEQIALGIKEVGTLAAEYDTRAYFSGLRRRLDGRANAFGRDLGNIQRTFGRHILNYSESDPYVNYPTDTTSVGHLGRFTTTFIGSLFR